MDVLYVNPFVKSTIDTFKTMINQDVTPGTVTIKKDTKLTYYISGIIDLSGDAKGAVAISFPKLVALKVVSAMLGTPVKVVGEEVADGIGELANIITGYAKQDLTQFQLDISLPKVVIGNNHFLVQPGGIPVLIVPFKNSWGNFTLEVSFKTT